MGYMYWSLCLLEQKDIHLHYVNHSFETIAFHKVGLSGLQPSVAGPTHLFFPENKEHALLSPSTPSHT